MSPCRRHLDEDGQSSSLIQSTIVCSAVLCPCLFLACFLFSRVFEYTLLRRCSCLCCAPLTIGLFSFPSHSSTFTSSRISLLKYRDSLLLLELRKLLAPAYPVSYTSTGKRGRGDTYAADADVMPVAEATVAKSTCSSSVARRRSTVSVSITLSPFILLRQLSVN